MFPAARIVVIVSILIIPLFFEVSALAFAMIWFAMQVIPGLISLGDTATGGVAWWAHIGGFVAGWLATPLLRRPAGAHRRYYRDEGIYGFLPDGPRQGAFENDVKMLNICKELGVCISIGSDAHIKEGICEFDRAYKVIEDTQFPEELIVNSDYSLYESYIGKKN